MQLSLLLVLILILASCSDRSVIKEENDYDNTSNIQYVKYKIPEDSLKNYLFSVDSVKSHFKIENFSNIDSFPETWVEISNSSEGLIIYYSSKTKFGNTINRIHDRLEIQGLGERVSWNINNFEKVDELKFVFNVGSDLVNGVYADYNFKVLNTFSLLTLVEWKVYNTDSNGHKSIVQRNKSLFVPLQKIHLFKHVIEPNQKSPDSWIPFKEIEFSDFE